MKRFFFHQVGLRSKLATMALIAIVLIAFPALHLWNQTNVEMTFDAREKLALQPIRETQELIHRAQLNRARAVMLLLGKASAADYAGTQRAVEEQLTKLQALPQLANEKPLQDSISGLRQMLGNLANPAAGETADAFFTRHIEYVDQIYQLLQGEAAVFGLRLDPEPASYNLYDASLNGLVNELESVARIRGYGIQGLADPKNGATALLRIQPVTHTLSTQLQTTNRILGYAKAAQVEHGDQEMANTIEKILVDNRQTVAEVVELANQLGSGKATTLEQWVRVSSAALDKANEHTTQLLGLLEEEYNQGLNEKQALKNRLLMVFAALLLLMVGTALLVGYSIIVPLQQLMASANRIAQGDLSETGEAIKGKNEVARLAQAVGNMRQSLYDTQLRDQASARETARVVSALDNTSVNVMIADSDRKIIYMNSSVRKMLKKAEADLRKVLPSFDVDKLIGKSIDEFHKNPSHQSHLLASITTAYQAKIAVAGFHFRLIANPIFDGKGERLGSVVEWLDITDEVHTEEEVAALIEAASQGNFSSRLELAGKDGFFKILTEGINSLLDTTERGLTDVGAMFTALAAGNLTHRMAGDYSGMFARLQDDANLTVERLTEIVHQIKESSDTILTAAREIAAGNQNLSQRTESQAASLEETASAMEELTSTVKQNAENSRQANQLARGASDIAEKAGGVVGEVVDTMKGINSSANKIVDIIAVIDDIAFQTNILALNAAVEAARAGEQGRGFAVVASEVRNLAQRSAAAAKEIKQLINDSVDKVESGSLLVNQAGQTMEEVVNSVKHVTDIMSEISAASTEQSAGIQEVNQTVTQMDDMTQQNAALVEEAAAAAKSLEEQSHRLTEAVSAFRLSNEAPARAARTSVHLATPVELPVREAPKEEGHNGSKGSKKKANGTSTGASNGSGSRRLPKTIAEDDWEHF